MADLKNKETVNEEEVSKETASEKDVSKKNTKSGKTSAKSDAKKAGKGVDDSTEKDSEKKKVVTKYDRKMEKRRAEAKREARNKKIAKISTIAILAALAVALVTTLVINLDRIYREYIKVDGESVNQVEFDFYYSLTKGNILNQQLAGNMTYLNYFEAYLGYDSSKSDKKQKYDETNGYTWYDYFANATVSTMKEYNALLNMAEENGFDYTDADADYEEFMNDAKEAAEKAEVSLSKYYKDVFGAYATKSSVDKYIREYLKASAYQEKIYDEKKPNDDEVKSYYEEHKDDYDTVDYRSVYIKAETENDEAALDDAKRRATEFAASITSEETFVDNCIDYVAKDDVETYSEDKASLVSDKYKSSLSTDESEWLFSADRKKGDVTVIEQKNNNRYEVIYFVSREYDMDNNEVIRSTIYSERYEELIKPYIEAVKVENKNNRIKMLGE